MARNLRGDEAHFGGGRQRLRRRRKRASTHLIERKMRELRPKSSRNQTNVPQSRKFAFAISEFANSVSRVASQSQRALVEIGRRRSERRPQRCGNESGIALRNLFGDFGRGSKRHVRRYDEQRAS